MPIPNDKCKADVLKDALSDTRANVMSSTAHSGDTSPSVAPTEKTIAPKPRPEGLKAEE